MTALRKFFCSGVLLCFSASLTAQGWQSSNGNTTTTENVGIGTTSPPPQRLTVTGGHIAVDNGFQLDVAEWVSADEAVPSGTVVVVGEDANNTVAASTRAYDMRRQRPGGDPVSRKPRRLYSPLRLPVGSLIALSENT